jgi:hypothetical protein
MTAPGNAKTAAAAALTALVLTVLGASAQAASLPSVTASVVLTPPAIAPAPSLSAAPSTGTVEASASASLPPASVHLGAGVSSSGSYAGVAAGTSPSDASQPPRQASPSSPAAHNTVTPLPGSTARAGATTGASASNAVRGSHAAGEETLEEFAAREARARHSKDALGLGAGPTAPTHAAASITRLASGSTPATPTALPRSGGAHRTSAGGNDLPSLNLPPAGGEALEVALIVVGAMLLTALLFADELKLGERYRDLRARLSHRRLG